MCQSKSEGGIRCESHAKRAINDHQIAYSKLVQQECAAKGITIDPACYELTPEETARVDSRHRDEPAVKKAYGDASEATRKRNRLRMSLRDALASGDINRYATLIRENNPELQAITDDNTARRTKLAETMARITDEKEKEEAIEKDKQEYALLNKRKAKLNFVSKKEAMDTWEDYRRTGDSERIVHNLTCMKQVTKDIEEIRTKSDATIRRERERQRELTISSKVYNDPGFQKVAASTEFRTSPEFQKWDAKESELMESYRMTSGYQNQVAAKISDYKKAGMDTTEMEAAYKDLTVRRAKFAFDNIAAVHGTSSPEAKSAASAYVAARQKIHVF